MRKIMTDHLNAFVRYLNRNYQGINARLKVNKFARSKWDNPRVQVPGTNRKIYQVITYQIITGHDEVTDIVDTALAVYPGSSRSMLHLPYSYKLGIPIQRLRYQLKDSLALLSGSFIHRGLIAGRNPLTGVVKEKGQKNVERVDQLLKIIKSRRKYYQNLGAVSKVTRPLLDDIARSNIPAARRNAKAVNRALKKIK
jgi:hypothetical protein